MDVTDEGMTTDLRASQPDKADIPIELICFGRISFVIFEQPMSVSFSRVVKPVKYPKKDALFKS